MMIEVFLLIAGAAGVGVFAALELHGVMRRHRRRRATEQAAGVPKPSDRAEPLSVPPMPRIVEPDSPWPRAAVPEQDPPQRQQQRLEQLARNLLDPDVFGHAVTPEVRNAARTALGRPSFKPTK